MLVFIDFESYYDNEYSLGRMPTAQYIRDARWRCLGCAIATDTNPAHYAQPETLQQAFDAVDWEAAIAVAHNAAFDGAVLMHHYGKRPKRWVDTSLIARWLIAQGYLGPDQRANLGELAPLVGMAKGDTWQAVHGGDTAAYGLDDLEIMRALLQAWGAKGWLAGIPPLEWDLMDLHIRCATEPVLHLDRPLLESAVQARDQHLDLYKRLRKDDAFAQALRTYGIEPETKTTPKGNTKYAFAAKDTQMLELQQHPSPYVSRLAELKLEAHSSITHTRAQRFLDVGTPMPVPELYYGAHTARSAGLDSLNLLNLPRGGLLRKALKAAPGHKLVIVDSGQIEARTVNYLACQEDALERFRRADQGKDVDAYRQFGGQYLYGVPPAEIGKGDHRRHVAKQAVLALGFGQGPGGFRAYCKQMGIVIDAQESERVVSIYRQTHPRVQAFQRECLAEVVGTSQQTLLSGRLLTYPGLHVDQDEYGRDSHYYLRHAIFSKGRKGHREKKKVWHGFATENRVQADARDIVLWQTAQLAPRWRVVMSTYDEAVFHVPEDQAEQCLTEALEVFSTAPPFAPNMPVVGEGVISDDYGAKP